MGHTIHACVLPQHINILSSVSLVVRSCPSMLFAMVVHDPNEQVSFIKEYWNRIFAVLHCCHYCIPMHRTPCCSLPVAWQPLLEEYTMGRVPNPDVACNREVHTTLHTNLHIMPCTPSPGTSSDQIALYVCRSSLGHSISMLGPGQGQGQGQGSCTFSVH